MKTLRKNEIKKKMTKCRYCHSKENLTIDHRIPISQGGTDAYSNLQCLCKPCNEKKSSLSHKQVMFLFRWFLDIQENRAKLGGKLMEKK